MNHLVTRDASVVDIEGLANSPNIDRNDNSAIMLKGAATSTCDLGTAASPGHNTLADNTYGVAPGTLWLNASGVTVTAVGNTWDPSAQGTDADGHFALGVARCGATTCDVTNGGGRPTASPLARSASPSDRRGGARAPAGARLSSRDARPPSLPRLDRRARRGRRHRIHPPARVRGRP